MKTPYAVPALLLAAGVLGACAGAPPDAPDGRVMSESQCASCGTVRDIETVSTQGRTSGAGAVIGAVIGGVVGHQLGGGRGQDAATAAGAVGGAVAGNEMERRRQATGAAVYRVTVAMDSGGVRQIDVPDLNGLTAGSRVKLVGNDIQMIS
jgi:outer membrane lipoprotein SlyB